MLSQGCILALTGKPSDAVHTITAGITASRSTGATLFTPLYLSYLAGAYAELGNFDDGWRCIDEAMTLVETTKESLCEAEVNRVAGEIALMSPEPDGTKAEAYFERALLVARAAASKVLGTPRGDEHGAALARSGQAGEARDCSRRSMVGSPKASTRSI